jgi:hypothetical protein
VPIFTNFGVPSIQSRLTRGRGGSKSSCPNVRLNLPASGIAGPLQSASRGATPWGIAWCHGTWTQGTTGSTKT